MEESQKKDDEWKEQLLPDSSESRREIVSKFVNDILQGKIALSINQEKWRQEDIELIGSTSKNLIVHLNDYLSGTKAGEEFEYVERQILFCMSVLRTYGAFKTNLSESKLEEEIRTLASKIDAIKAQLDGMLTMSKESAEKGRKRTATGKPRSKTRD
jgi:ASC-1-like (ASCH) protein